MELRKLRVGLAVVALAGATNVGAQEHAAFEELRGIVTPGQTYVVRSTDGDAFTGRLVSTSENEIVIARSRRFRRPEERTFQAHAINRISRVDSRWNGTLIGIAVGVGSAGAIAVSNEWNPDRGAPGAFVAYGVLLGGAGAAVGWGIDTAFKRTVYDASVSRPRVSIVPLMHRGRPAVVASLRF
jgi:hypothetical protein